MANVEDKFRSLAEGLYIGSTTGRLKWSPFPETNSYITIVNDAKIEIASSVNNEGEDLFIINVFDKNGTRIDTFTDEYFSRKIAPQHVTASNYFILMSNLYEIARRNATGADRVLDSILDALGAPKIDSDEVPF